MNSVIVSSAVTILVCVVLLLLTRKSRTKFEDTYGRRSVREYVRLACLVLIISILLFTFSYLLPTTGLFLNGIILLAGLLGVTSKGRSLWNDVVYSSVFGAILVGVFWVIYLNRLHP